LLQISPFKFGVWSDIAAVVITPPSDGTLSFPRPSWVAVSRFSFGKNRVEYCHQGAAAVLNKLGVFGMFPANVIWITIE
jgi:hypothetical protein